jgi:hypothetical protein
MAPLTAAVWSAYDPQAPAPGALDAVDEGGRELVAGLVGAFTVRALIQQSIGIVMADTGHDADAAYLDLCSRTAEAGGGLAETAARVVAERPG